MGLPLTHHLSRLPIAHHPALSTHHAFLALSWFMPSTVEVTRGDLIESRHVVSVAVVRADGTVHGVSGNPDLVAFWRSCAKPFQAMPLLLEGAAAAYGITDAELALACASHNGEPAHVELARTMLARSGADESALVCGPHPSINEDIARDMLARGEQLTGAHSNCSGKHAGMIATARYRRWGSDGYANPQHPLQQACLAEVARWAGLQAAAVPHATDGCGVPSFALPLRAMALAYARLGAALAGDKVEGQRTASINVAARLLGAMRTNPFLIAGTGRLDTELVAASGGRVVAKVGAEGVYCATIPELRLGLALKVEDGATRSLGPALLGLLDLVAPGFVTGLEEHRHPQVRNTLGATVGRLEARMELQRDASRG